jgi:hypothetical protein
VSKRLTIVTREVCIAYVSACKELRDHITEGNLISCVQWLDAEGIVRAQFIYQRVCDGMPLSNSYEIDETYTPPA